jgi:cyclopropane-fatty-acyl-phospholipid synthase
MSDTGVAMSLPWTTWLVRRARRWFEAMGRPPVRLCLWDGTQLGMADARTGVRILDPGALVRLLVDPELQAGDLYSEGRVEIEGDPIEFVREVYAARPTGVVRSGWIRRLVDGARSNDLISARRSAQHHYDLGNDFYQLWLDERMQYTCAYFPSPEAGLEAAQVAKLDHVCRKLDLRAGERVIEAGCGWGGLALHMARVYGARVRAYNVSEEQVAWAREQAVKQELHGRVEFVLDDYRAASGRADKFVSVGMLEHVGPEHFGELGRVIERTLQPDGLALIHTIGRSIPLRLHRWIARRVFPNAHPPTLREMMDIFEPHDFAVLDVENLRLHYALTLRHWLARYERAFERAVAMVGRERARAWRLYLAGSVAAFERGSLHLFQVVVSRAANDRIPWTRAQVYAPRPAPGGA